MILTADYLQVFKKAGDLARHQVSQMGAFLFRVRLVSVGWVSTEVRRGYLCLLLHLINSSAESSSRILLRSSEGIREWHTAIKELVNQKTQGVELREARMKNQNCLNKQYSDLGSRVYSETSQKGEFKLK